MRLQLFLMAVVRAAGLAALTSIATLPAQAATINITYSNTGNLTTAPVLNGTLLTLDALATGSVISVYPSLNAVWNPVSFHTHDFLDITTGQDSGTFTMTFANGATLFGNIFETDSLALLTTNQGPFTQTLVFLGGTGSFAGASGSTAGGGVVGTNGFTTSGSGTLSGPGVVPEPGTLSLMATGLLGAAGAIRRRF